MKSSIRFKKKGFSLSLELVIVFLIISLITVIVALSFRTIMQLWKTNQVMKEYGFFTDAILQFRQIYGHWPGDVPMEKMGGDLNHESSMNGPQSMLLARDLGMNSNIDVSHWMLGNDYVLAKSMFAFRQLALGGIIHKNKINMECNLTMDFTVDNSNIAVGDLANKCISSSTTQAFYNKNAMPAAAFDSDLIWMFTYLPSLYRGTQYYLDNFDTKYLITADLSSSTYYGNGGNIRRYIKGMHDVPMLWLMKMPASSSNFDLGLQDVSTSQYLSMRASLSSRFARNVDFKMDDGYPTTPGGKVSADDGYANPVLRAMCADSQYMHEQKCSCFTHGANQDEYFTVAEKYHDKDKFNSCIMQFTFGNRADY